MNSKRIIYIDYLKVIAIFSIIFMHIAIFWSTTGFLKTTIHNVSQCARFAVPLFLMISGALLLNRNIPNFKDYFIKKSYRIFLPYIFYVFLMILLTILYNHLFVFNNNLIQIILFNLFTPDILWYFWLIIGVYLSIPVINEFVRNKGMEGVKYFLTVAIIGSIFYQICNISRNYTFLDLRFFFGPVLYLFLGYYLHNKEFSISDNKMILISVILFLVTSFCKIGFGIVSSDISFFYGLNNFTWTTGENIFFETFLDLGIVEIIHSSSIFLFFKYASRSKILNNKILVKLSNSIARSTWGIYCCHVIFLLILTPLVANISLSGTMTFILIVIISLLVLFLTHVITLILSKIPFLKKFSGYF